MFDIYSIGDSLFLQQVLNALAMITGTGGFMVLVRIGFTMGIIFIVMQAIVEGGRGISIQHTLIGWLLFSMLFGATATVRINDVYTGQVRVVDNVPYGVAATGSIISTVGYHTTELFEMAFSTPTMTSNGFSSALLVLAKTRQAFLDKNELGVVNSPTAGTTDDIIRSWQNYIKDCTLVGVDLNKVSWPGLMSNPFPRLALKWNSDVYGTEIFLDGTVSDVSCTDAWLPLIGSTSSTAWQDGVEQILHARLDNTGALFSGAVSPTAATDMVTNALSRLTLSSVSARRYILAAVLQPALEEATVGKDLVEQGFTHALMARDAIERRNSEWAAGQSMFFTIVRPVLTFIEGFTYAIAPFIAFLVGIGTVGIKAAGKYVLTIIWIQLWMPLLAIVNLFINMSATYKLSALTTATSMSLPSYGAMYQLDGVLQNYIAFGGMLSSIVPGIALMLVYGGSWATTGLVDRMSSTSQVDATQATPKALSQGALLATAPMYTSDSAGGLIKSGAERLLPSINLGSRREMAMSSALGSRETYDNMMSHATTVGNQVMSSTSESDSMVKDWVAGVKNDNIKNVGSSESLAGVLSAGLSAGAMKGALESKYGTDTANKIQESIYRHSGVKSAQGVEAKYQDALHRDVEAGHKTAYTENMSAEDRKLVQSAQSTGMSSQLNLRDASNAIFNNGRLNSGLASSTPKLGLEGQAHFWAINHQNALGVTWEQAVIMGRLIALDNAAAGGNKAANAELLSTASQISGVGTGYGNEMPDAKAGGLTREALNDKGDEVKVAAEGFDNSVDLYKEKQANKGWVQGKQQAAQNEMGIQQAAKLESNLKSMLGQSPDLMGNDQSLVKITTEGGMAAIKTGQDFVKFGIKEGQASLLGSMTNFSEALSAAGSAWENTKGSPATRTAAATNAFATTSWSRPGSSEEVGAFYHGLHKTAVAYGQEKLGLTKPQAEYFAYEQTNYLGRVTNMFGANPVSSFQTEDAGKLRAAVGNETVASAIKQSVETGNQTYLGMVKDINRAKTGTFN